MLPELKKNGTKIDFAFIDGWHTFDHALVDFFYIDSLLNTGGIIVFDDVGYASIKRLCHFIVTNRAYEVIDQVDRPDLYSISGKFKGKIKKIINRVVRTNMTPTLQDKKKINKLSYITFLALKKTHNDDRHFAHFVNF